MAQPLVAPYFHLSLNVLRDFAPEVTFYLIILVDVPPNPHDLIICKVLDAGIGVYPSCLERFSSSAKPYSIDIGKGDFYPLFSRQIDARYACQVLTSSAKLQDLIISS